MEAKELKLECLKLAVMAARDPVEILARAKVYAEFVLNTKDLDLNAESDAGKKAPSHHKKKSDNSKDIMS